MNYATKMNPSKFLKTNKRVIKGNFDKQDSFLTETQYEVKTTVDKQYNYYIYYVKKQNLKQVSKKIFCKVEGIFRCINNNRIKFIGISKGQIDIGKFKQIFKAEGSKSLFYYIKNIYSHVTMLVDSIEKLKQINFKELILDIVSFFLSIYGQFESNNVFNLAAVLFDFYRLVSRNYLLKAEGLDSFVFGAASFFMPQHLYEIFKRMQTFSNVKILDDFKIFQSTLSTIFEFLKGCISILPFSEDVKKQIFKFVDKFINIDDYFLMKEMRDLVLQFKKDIRITADISFQRRVQAVKDKFCENIFVSEWTRKSATAKNLFDDFSYIVRVVDSYLATSRVEPCCFIFEGPAGCGKSLMLNNISTLMNKSKYVHSTKSFMDGKNFYDMYNNEYLYIEDDIGQMGVSQWRTIINFVSSVKCPLECAEIKNKGIKFFSSPVLLLSTNHFINLPPLLKTDCISDIQALHRRGYVFDFTNMRINQNGFYSGEIFFKTYNVLKNCWEGFSFDMCNFLIKNDINLSDKFKIGKESFEENMRLYAWVKDIITMCTKIKIEYANYNDISRFKDEVHKYSVFSAETKTYKFTYKGVDIGHFIPNFLNFDESFFDTQEVWLNGCEIVVTGLEQYFHTPSFDYLMWLMWWINDNLIFTVIKPDESPDIFLSNLLCLILNFLIIYILYKLVKACAKGIYNYICPKEKVGKQLHDDVSFTRDFCAESVDLHPSIYAIQKQLFEIDLISQAGHMQAHGLCSGHCILTASHLVKGDMGFVTIFKNKLQNHRLLDNKKFKVIYRNDKVDVVIIKIDEFFPTPFKNLSKHFKTTGNKNTPKLWYINSAGALELQSKIIHKEIYDKYYLTYENGEQFEGKIDNTNILYSIRGDGQCGSLIVSPFNGVVGLHVAGSSVNGMGVGSFFCDDTIKNIHETLLCDDKYYIDANISSREQTDFSGIKIDLPIAASTPKQTNFDKSPLYGLFEPEREPVNLSIYGPHTVKDIAKKSFKPVKSITLDELNFVSNVFKIYIDEYTDISEREVVLGGDLLARMNKDSCNGFQKLREKSAYIDYVEGKYTDLLVDERKKFISDCVAGQVNYTDIVWVETLKDELRSIEKNGVPRSFRYCNIVTQCLAKEVFGNLVRSIMKNKWFNGVMIGINPYKDWDMLYTKINQLSVDGGFFDGDFKNWDGGMLPQIQELIIDVLCLRYKGNLPQCVVRTLLQSLVGCLVVVNDDVYITNHSMPSGFYLTTLVNCLVNICYSVLYYYRTANKKELKPTVKDYFDTIFPITYGDDLIMVVKKQPFIFHALSYCDFCTEIGLGFTTASKGMVTKRFNTFDELTFLKRSFRMDHRIGRVMCPLDLRTIRSSILFYDTTKDMNVVINDKLHAFQREIYLHADIYEEYMERLIAFCAQKNIFFTILPENYLRFLYINDPDSLYETSYK